MEGQIKSFGSASEEDLNLLKLLRSENVDLSSNNLGPADAASLSACLAMGAGAVLNSIMLDECLITGTTFGAGREEGPGQYSEKIEQLDVDLSGFTALCSSLSSSQIVSISLRKCYLGPQALALLTDAIKVMAAVTKVDLRGNDFDSASMDALRSAAPQGCEVLFD